MPERPEPSVFDAEPTCTSGEYWDDGDDGDRRMHPGRACVSCHAERDGPRFAIAGTVFPTAHEPDECEGLDGEDDVEARVVITDATGREFQLEVNEVGNFHSAPGDDIVMPIRAKVVQGDRERVMFGERMSGDCNACHTQNGENGAPGRIVAP
jgi:mono/diheme cytochrome c family protein